MGGLGGTVDSSMHRALACVRLFCAVARESPPMALLCSSPASYVYTRQPLPRARPPGSHTGWPERGMDSGLCVRALGDEPGVHSAVFACESSKGLRSDLEDNRKLVRTLAGVADRAAWFVSVLVLTRSPNDPMPLIAQGVWPGQVVDEPRGDGGFGYDPYFLVPSLELTAAQLSAEQKNQFSHRAQAMRRLLRQLDDV